MASTVPVNIRLCLYSEKKQNNSNNVNRIMNLCLTLVDSSFKNVFQQGEVCKMIHRLY